MDGMKNDEEVIDPIKDIEAFEYTLYKIDGEEAYNPLNEANMQSGE